MDQSSAGNSASASPLAIKVVSGTGVGRTLLSSFDAALRDCGVYNYNLIALSSVIPPGAEVTPEERYETPPGEHGHRLYVVKADQRSDHPGEGIAAGVGWVQWDDGRGVFVEHEATAATAAAARQCVEASIRASLADLCAFRGIPFEPCHARSKIACATVTDSPASVIVAAVYRSEGWS